MADKRDDRLQLEWLVVNALRENLSMLDSTTNVNYNRAIEFGQQNFKSLFGSKDSILGQKKVVDPVYERYLEEAQARSAAEGKTIKALDLIRLRIEEIERLIKNPSNKEARLVQLNREKRKLKRIYNDNPEDFLMISEDEALRNDYEGKRPELEYVKQAAGKSRWFRTKSGDSFAMRFLHPGKAETATGVDLVYELHEELRVRVVAVQYKMWDINGVIYFSAVRNIEQQLTTAKTCFCDNGFCESESNDKPKFRLPYCIPFLRPTDRLHNPDSPSTSAWHIPVCQINNKLEYSKEDGKILRRENIMDVSLNAAEFERMFDKGLIGSRWMEIDELQNFYKQNKVLEKNENIIIYTQKF